ncbi:MAG: DUF1289 domain-containing protein [Rubripirellula sp.]
MDDQSFQPKSPCTGICKLHPQNYCIGCFRSLDEIAQWGSSNAQEKESILSRCDARKKISSQQDQSIDQIALSGA